ncbi:GNAT family N-acetyltransferase [Frankia sp. AiPs1]|uniref:GNAT family N-acetyltransferase n=1 Tax=Frankia sp. AiPs1 TaxID=573493 RepID=UPI002043A7DC|nr:GNAT family N-acetyltransferase [Frankia sp. AiPs1]MCM3920293.1 GNAT family N-acetyltransferase [Frankia sp. AiPs1]
MSDDPVGVGRLLAHDPGALLVADHNGDVVGTVVAGWDGWRGHVYRLVVDPEHRRRGVARALLSAAHDRFAALGAVLADALVEDDNADARATYEAIGTSPAGAGWYGSYPERTVADRGRAAGRSAMTTMPLPVLVLLIADTPMSVARIQRPVPAIADW